MYRYSLLLIALFLVSCGVKTEKSEPGYIQKGEETLAAVTALYGEKKYGLMRETYPAEAELATDYLGTAEETKTQEVAYLWPYSGVVSACVALYEATGDENIFDKLEQQLLPGLESYWDAERIPAGYQSYPVRFVDSDRYYDDNVWIAIDFCTLYELTNDAKYLDKAMQLYDFIYSGWDDKLGGGIYWCEQFRNSKNTCSNAPAAVLSLMLYEITDGEHYLARAIDTYEWTRNNLMDPDDLLYRDNISLEKKTDRRKYSYNTGQMVQAGVKLAHITGEEKYLEQARATASSAEKFFTDTDNPMGYRDMAWFNVIYMRGLVELYKVDRDPSWLENIKTYADTIWQSRDEDGLFTFGANDKDGPKWLLNNAAVAELMARLAMAEAV